MTLLLNDGFNALKRFFILGGHTGTPALVMCNYPIIQNRMVHELKRSLHDLAVVPVPSPDVDLISYIDEAAKVNKVVAKGILVTGFGRLLTTATSDSPLYAALNSSRGYWEELFDGVPVTMWIPDFVDGLFAKYASHFEAMITERFRVDSKSERHYFLFEDPAIFSDVSANRALDRSIERIHALEARIRQPNKSIEDLGAWYLELGATLRRVGDFDRAERLYYDCHEIFKRHDRVRDELKVSAHRGLGLVFQSRGMAAKAIEAHNLAKDLSAGAGSKVHQSVDDANLGVCYEVQEHSERAFKYFRAAHQALSELVSAQTAGIDAGALMRLGVICAHLVRLADKLHLADETWRDHDARVRDIATRSGSAELEVFFDDLRRFQADHSWPPTGPVLRNMIRANEVGPYLRALRRTYSREADDIESRLATRLKEVEGRAVLGGLLQLTKHGEKCNLASLEDGAFDINLSPDEVSIVAEVYEVPRVLLDPLFAMPVEDQAALLDLHEDFVPVGTLHSDVYGRRSQYFVPSRRLRGTDVAFVYVELDPGGRSGTHAQPGDEMVMVLDGTVEVRFEQTGIRTRLERNEVLHFFAEQVHSIENLLSDKVARLLVLRFHHVAVPTTRARFLERTKEQQTAHLMEELADWIYPTLAGPVEPPTFLSRVYDRYGLFALLERLGVEKGAVTPEGNTSPIKASDLLGIASKLHIEPVIFANFMFPAWPNVVAIRREDWVELTGDFAPTGGATYSVPIRSLLFADIAVDFVSFELDGGTPWNHHPGCEAVFLLRGQVRVEFRGNEEVVLLNRARRQFAQFYSHREHRVVNNGNAPAAVIVIRLYAEGETVARSASVQ